MAETPDLRRIRDSLTLNEKAAREVVAGLTQIQLEAQPAGGWSILQCLEHLAITNRIYTGAMAKVLERGRAPRKAPVKPSAGGKWFLGQLEPPVKKKVQAPRGTVPSSGKTCAEVMDEYARSHDEIRKLIDTGSQLDLNAIKFRNPLLPLLRVRVGTGFLIMAAHGRRHLWQANQVRAAVVKDR